MKYFQGIVPYFLSTDNRLLQLYESWFRIQEPFPEKATIRNRKLVVIIILGIFRVF